MNRQEKADFVRSFNEGLQSAPLVIVAGFRGTKVNQVNQLRRVLRENNITLRVVKNSLARIALDGTGMEVLASHFVGMTAMFLSGEEAISAAKFLRTTLAGDPTLQVIAGDYQGEGFVGDAVKGIADLPSREDLLSMLLRTMQEPASQILNVLQAPARDLVNLLQNFETKLSEAAGE